MAPIHQVYARLAAASALVGLGVWMTCAAFGKSQQAPIDRKAWMAPVPSAPLLLVRQPRHAQDAPTPADYLRVLERFPAFGERGWRGPYLGRDDVGFFGDPDSAEMGMRSMGNFVFVTALLAAEPAYDPKVTGVSSERLLSRARACLRYMTDAHVTGSIVCGNGKPWGHHWQSAWWTAKMAIGARLIWDRLTVAERAAVRRVVADEASRHLARKPPSGAASDTKSEENAWDTEVLATAAAFFPDDARAPEWRKKLIEFLVNSLSAPQDKGSDELIDGVLLRELAVTSNIRSDFTIENHGAYHTCYMACPLHSLAWGAYAFQAAGVQPPQAQFHHFQDVWRRLAPTFLERRFAYPAGKDWPRYAYGQSFIMPALVTLWDRFGDEVARAVEARRFRAFEEEQLENRDGTFFGRRFTRNVMMDRLLEYETDAYANLGLCYLIHQGSRRPRPRAMPDRELAQRLTATHVSDESLLAWVRTPELFASFSWKRLEGVVPSAHFIPAGCDDIAEWGPANLVGRITAAGVSVRSGRVERRDEATADGLKCTGTVRYARTDGTPAYTLHVGFDVDARERWADVRSRFVAESDLDVRSVEGLRLHVVNDRFNRGRRTWAWDRGRLAMAFDLRGPWPERETIRSTPFDGRWVNIDNRVGVIAIALAAGGFTLRTSDRRNGPWGSIHYDVLDCPRMSETPRRFRRGDIVLETAFRVVAGSVGRTREVAARTR